MVDNINGTGDAAAPLGAAAIPQVSQQIGQLPPDVVTTLNEKANKHGLRYTELESEYLKFTNLPEMLSKSPEEKKRHAMLMIGATCASYANNPLIDYELLVYGYQFNRGWKSSKIVCGSAIPGKDVPELFNNGTLGIPTVISNFEGKYLEVEKIQPFTFYRANLTGSQVGAARRDISSTNHTTFVPINHPEVTREQIQKWLDKNYPIRTLASLKQDISRTITGKKAGSKPYADLLDFRRITVSIVRASVSTGNNWKFYTYTVQDDSLTDEERLNTKAGDRTIYGGVAMSVPEPIYNTLNLDEASIIDALVTVRKIVPGDDGIMTAKIGIALDAIAVFPVVAIHKKVPTAQQTGGSGKPGGQTQSFDLAAQ